MGGVVWVQRYAPVPPPTPGAAGWVGMRGCALRTTAGAAGGLRPAQPLPGMLDLMSRPALPSIVQELEWGLRVADASLWAQKKAYDRLSR